MGSTYTAYAVDNQYTVTGADNAVDIKTGYIKATVSAITDGGKDLTQSWAVSDIAGTPAATLSAVPVKVGATLTGTMTFGTTGTTDADTNDTIVIAITGGADIALDVAGADDFATVSNDKKTLTMKVADQVKGTSFTWTITAGEADITNVAVTYTVN